MKKVLLLAIALFVASITANAQYSKSTDGPITYKFGNFYDYNGQVIKGQENVISYIGSDNYFNIYQKAHKRYMTGAIVGAAGIGMFTVGCLNKKRLEGGIGTYGTLWRVWSYPFMIIGGTMFFRNNSKLKQLAKEYNYNHPASLSFGPTPYGIGLALNF